MKLRNQYPDITKVTPSDMHSTIPVPLCQNHFIMNINCSIPGLKAKAVQTKEEIKWYTNVHLNENFPKESRIRIYTDGSVENASKNGGSGIYIQYTDRKEEQISLMQAQPCSKTIANNSKL